jgi:phage anti-repressor protein
MPNFFVRVLSRADLRETLSLDMTPGKVLTVGTLVGSNIKLNPLIIVNAKEKHATLTLAADGTHWIVENISGETEEESTVAVVIKEDRTQKPIAVKDKSAKLHSGDEIIICGRRFRLCAEDTKEDIEVKAAFERKKMVRKQAALKAAETRRKMRKTAEEVAAN